MNRDDVDRGACSVCGKPRTQCRGSLDGPREPDLLTVMFACAFLVLTFLTAVWAVKSVTS